MNDKNKAIQPYEQGIFAKVKNFIKSLFVRKKTIENEVKIIEESPKSKISNNDLQNKIDGYHQIAKLKSLISKDKSSVYSMSDEELNELIKYYKGYISDLKRKIHSSELEIKKLEKVN